MADETNNALTPEQMAARIAEVEARVAKGGALRFKVSEKGAVSVYGLGRFPVTLYLEQWENLLSHTDELRQYRIQPSAPQDQGQKAESLTHL
jgi:hypothetical protein